ncbi:MAG: cation-translocating P-type ATPase [Aliarcobacter sp.]|nr:cation-translocating P-type ATPase [Aliarcobacter sp.]
MNFTTEFKGLTEEEVIKNRKEYGENVVPPPERDPWWKMYLETYEDPIIRILLIAIVLSLIISGYKFYSTGHFEWYEPVGVIVAVLLATYIGFINTWKAMKQFDVLNQVNNDIKVIVIRNGYVTEVPKTQIVVGDVVILETGAEIPADGDILEATSLQVNESKLTGESVPVNKLPEKKIEGKNTKTAYAPNQVLSSTIVQNGYGLMRVSAVGENTEIGKTTKEALEENEDPSPLQKQLDKTAQVIGVIAFGVASVLFTILLLRGLIVKDITLTKSGLILLLGIIGTGLFLLTPVWLPIIYDYYEIKEIDKEKPEWLESSKAYIYSIVVGLIFFGLFLFVGNATSESGLVFEIKDERFLNAIEHILNYFMIAVTLIVVAVPEGLPMATTMGLAFSMKKMLKENVLVKRMMACEAIGAVTVICTDKTGTLTMNEMRVKDKQFFVDEDEFFYEMISVNGTANLDRTSEPAKVVGNPTEGSFLLYLEGKKIDYSKYRADFNIECEIPFNTQNKYMVVAGLSNITKEHVVFAKGAPEKLIEFCNKEALSGSNGKYNFGELNKNRKTEIIDRIIEFQNRGMRVIGFAYEPVKDRSACNIEELKTSLIWLGFMVIEDPPRKDVPNAIKMCQKAGIEVKIITGDNPLTAAEIGKQVGISGGKFNEGELITSDDYNLLNGNALTQETLKLKVLARAKPADKMTMVNILKANGHVVAMTGDGTNDAPAMNASDCGIAMGISGTATAKEASDLILMNDSFSSIVTGVLWGRTIYLNIQKFILFQLTVNFVAIVMAVIGPFIGVEFPLTVIQMLWVNLIMDTFAALALATEPPKESIMEEKPRNPKDFIITSKMTKDIVFTGTIMLITLIAMLLYWKSKGEIGLGEQSIFFTTFILFQFWNLFNARIFGDRRGLFEGLKENKIFTYIALTILVVTFIMVQSGTQIFRTAPLSLITWVKIFGFTSLISVINFAKRKISK